MIAFDIVVIIIMSFYWNTQIDRTYNCIEFSLDTKDYDEFVEKNVSIKGRIRQSILREDRVELNIDAGGLNIPDLELHPLVFPYRHSGNISSESSDGEITIMFKNVEYMQQSMQYIGDGYYRIPLYYEYYNLKDVKRNTIGTLYIDDEFNNIMIEISEKRGASESYWSGAEGRVIISAQSVREALVLKQHVHKALYNHLENKIL